MTLQLQAKISTQYDEMKFQLELTRDEVSTWDENLKFFLIIDILTKLE